MSTMRVTANLHIDFELDADDYAKGLDVYLAEKLGGHARVTLHGVVAGPAPAPPLCHCGHGALYHSSTNNRCFVEGCPCDEGFQSTRDEISPRLKAALARP